VDLFPVNSYHPNHGREIVGVAAVEKSSARKADRIPPEAGGIANYGVAARLSLHGGCWTCR
jgi:hypothetical protein